MVKFAEMPPAHPTCHLVRASIPRCRDGGRHAPALRYWFDIPLGIQSWIKEGSRLVLHLAVRTDDKKGICGETWGSCTETSWGRGRALGFNSLSFLVRFNGGHGYRICTFATKQLRCSGPFEFVC